ncbi:protein of unknown function [Methylorubrum extorquens]|uniref:Uncharacterized protein n=1 Tax=Methylorubrum extorquens TaxID=408 RepID=A0A2N9AVR5_METEX|nr:protein of unknown function [Methylorubrum extorquens]
MADTQEVKNWPPADFDAYRVAMVSDQPKSLT